MPSVTEHPPTPLQPAQASRKGEQLVDQQIRLTVRALKMVDITVGILTLVIGVLVFLLIAALMEHWILPGGWSSAMRTLLFGLLLLGIAWQSWRIMWPLLTRSINPAFAAQTIEQSSPSLKNSLLNLLLLRNRREQLSRQVYQAIEHQAAQRLSEVSIDTAIDRSAILRWGYLLVAVVTLCAIYRVLSPKNLFTSAERLLMPWSEIAVPSRVQISKVSPRETSVARGEQLEISAEVQGLVEKELVWIRYSTADQQIVDQRLPMVASSGGMHFSGQLPGRLYKRIGGGVQQDFVYWIEAGDARSAQYRVTVFARPTLVVQQVRYEYPTYTGYPSREEENTGDIRAIEGTLVTLNAQANKPIGSAHVDFQADGRNDLLMNADEKRASVTFPLELKSDRRTPRYESYVLRYLTEDGHANQLPPKYQIDVTPDYAPEIRMLVPEEETIDVRVDEKVQFEVEARDPDFAVRNVAIWGEIAGERVLKETLLSKNHTGRFVGKLRTTPTELGLKVGDELEYWGAVADNRQPKPNMAFTSRRKLRVIGPGQGGGEGQQGNPQGESGNQGGEGNDQEQGEGGQDGQSGGSAGGQGQGEVGENQDSGEGAGQQEDATDQQEGQKQQGSGQGEGEQESNDDASEGVGGNSPADQNDDAEQDGQPSEHSSDPSAGNQEGQQSKVSPEGDDDGSAFQRIADHFDDQQGQSGDQQNRTDQGESQDGENQTPTDPSAADGTPDSDQSEGTAETDAAENGGANDPDGTDAGEQQRTSEQPGAEGQTAPGEQEGSSESEDQQAPGGQMSPEQGPAGAGENPGENQGSPDLRGEKQPREKQSGEPGETLQDGQEPPAQGEGESESESEGSQGGDRAGGGQEGGGQQADADGTGGAGQNQSAKDGAGQSGDPGEGEASSQPGEQQKSEGETGNSSQDQPGVGSEKSESPGEQPGGESAGGQQGAQEGEIPGAKPTAEGADEEPSDGQPSGNQDPADAAGEGQQLPQGGTGGKSTPPPPGETQPGDEASLDYTRKQTELILDKLDDQLKKKQVDETLLEKLGWSEEELQRFVDRWKKLKSEADADSTSEQARQKLDQTLRSLGLSPNRRTGFRSKITKDKLRELRDAYRSRTPLEYQEQVRAYVKGTAATQDE